MNWCKKRITNKDLLVRFADGTHRFYLEAVCGEPVGEGNLCRYCSSLTTQTKTQDVKTFPHGLVTGKYPDESHIYDSPWYHKKVEAYGPPSTEVLELAMQAQRKARSGVKAKNLKDVLNEIAAEKPVEVVAEKPVEVVAEKPVQEAAEKIPAKRGRKPKPQTENPLPTENKKTEANTVPTEKKKRVTKPKKTENVPTENPSEPVASSAVSKAIEVIPEMTEFVENMNDAIVLDKVVKVYLRPFTIGTTKYYRDSEREKLYSMTAQQKVGKYVGRWDSEDQKIIKDAPDSDEE